MKTIYNKDFTTTWRMLTYIKPDDILYYTKALKQQYKEYFKNVKSK